MTPKVCIHSMAGLGDDEYATGRQETVLETDTDWSMVKWKGRACDFVLEDNVC